MAVVTRDFNGVEEFLPPSEAIVQSVTHALVVHAGGNKSTAVPVI